MQAGAQRRVVPHSILKEHLRAALRCARACGSVVGAVAPFFFRSSLLLAAPPTKVGGFRDPVQSPVWAAGNVAGCGVFFVPWSRPLPSLRTSVEATSENSPLLEPTSGNRRLEAFASAKAL